MTNESSDSDGLKREIQTLNLQLFKFSIETILKHFYAPVPGTQVNFKSL